VLCLALGFISKSVIRGKKENLSGGKKENLSRGKKRISAEGKKKIVVDLHMSNLMIFEKLLTI
jgi:hypothetical protein